MRVWWLVKLKRGVVDVLANSGVGRGLNLI